jgi:hypothetical protein
MLLPKLPNNWSQVTTEQYYELDKAHTLGLSYFEYQLEILAILWETSTDDELFWELEDETVSGLLTQLSFLKRPAISTKHSDYAAIDFNNLKLGEFIDIEYYLKQEESLHIAAAILYRKFKEDEWGHKTVEPYKYDIQTRAEELLYAPCTNVIPLIEQYKIWREEFLAKYENLFSAPLGDDEEDDELVGREKIEAMKESLKEKTQAAFAWESLLWDLSGGDITKWDHLFKTSLILVFNTLSMKHAKS